MLRKIIVLLIYVWNEFDQPFFEEPLVEVFTSKRDLDAFKKKLETKPECIYDIYEPILRPSDKVHITFGCVTTHNIDFHTHGAKGAK